MCRNTRRLRFVSGWFVAGVLLSLIPSVSAQPTNPANPSASVPAATNAPPWLNSKEPLQLAWRSFELHPHLRTVTFYDDNILYAAKHPQSDLINQISPGVQLLGGDLSTLRQYDPEHSLVVAKLSASSVVVQPVESWPDKFISADYSPRWDLYAVHGGNDFLNQFASANAIWPLAKLVVGINQDYSDEKTVITEAGQHNEIRQYHGELSAGYQFNPFLSLDAAVQYADVAYSGSTNLMGYRETKGIVELNRGIFDNFNVSVVLAGGLDSVGEGQGQQFVQFGGRARYALTEKMNLDATLGLAYRQFDAAVSARYDPYFTLNAVYQPWERTSFRLGVFRQQYPSLQSGQGYTETGGNFSLRRDFTDRFGILGVVSYYWSDFNSTSSGGKVSPSSDYYSLRLAGDLHLLKHLDAEAFYQFRGSGLAQGRRVQDNQCGLQFALHY